MPNKGANMNKYILASNHEKQLKKKEL